MRVLHCLRNFSPLSETFIYSYITGLAEHGIDTAVLAEERLLEQERPFDPVFRARRPRRLGKLYVKLARRWDQLAGLHDHMAVIRAWRPDVLHAHYGYFGCRMLPAARATGVPLVTTFYGHDISRLLRQDAWRRAYQDLAAQGSAFTFLSQAMLRDGTGAGFPAARSHVVHLTVDEAAFPFVLPSTKPSDGPARVLSVGRLVEKKGHDDLIRAAAQVVRAGREVRVTIIGDGPMRSSLEHLVESLHLRDRVVLAGAQSSDRVREAMAQAQVFALTSKTASDGDQEGTPTVLMEAMMAGLPICATTHAGIPEIVPETGHGWLAPEGDVSAIAACLCDLLEHREQWDVAAEAGRRRAEQEFTGATQIPKLARVYETVCGVAS